jgi:hypothetical protein
LELGQVDAPDFSIVVEDVVVFVLPGAAFAGDVGAAKDRCWSWLRCVTRICFRAPVRYNKPAQREHLGDEQMLKNIATFFVLLLVFLATFLTAEKELSPLFQSCISQQGERIGNGLGADITRYARCTGRFVDAHGVGITALASLVIAAFTGTLWIATIQQGQLTFASLDLARKESISTHRPHVVVRFIQGPFHDPTDHEFISVTIVNVGANPAIIEAFGGDLARRNNKGEWLPPGLDATPKNIHPVTLISGQRHTFTVTAKNPYSDTDIAADSFDEHELCAVGAVNYRDGNRVSRETGFFRIYEESSKRFVALKNTEFEYQD